VTAVTITTTTTAAPAAAGEGMTLAGEVEQHLPAPRRAVNASAEPFEALVARHETRVRRLAHRLLGWRDADVDDVVQDVFLAALDRLDRFRGEASVATWLTRVTINACRTRQRKRWISLKWLRLHRPARFSEEGSDFTANRDDTSSRVRRAILELSPRDREVIVLHHLEGMAARQIAELMGDRLNSVQVRLHRARQRLKTGLADLVDT
jgi:RNA polymerase sigma-70 factor, ECF subfamily